MVLTRSPLRISLGGGGTDLPSYYRNHGGFLISAAIDKYVFVCVTRPFTPGIYLKYTHADTLSQYFRSTMIAFFLKRTLINVEAKRSPIPMTSMHGGRAEPRGEGNLPPTRRPPPARQGRRDG